jgi:hypothetical protein
VAARGVCVTHVRRVVRLFPLQGCILIRISVTPLDMGDACSLCSNIVMELHYVDLRMMMMMLTTW